MGVGLAISKKKFLHAEVEGNPRYSEHNPEARM